MGTFLLVLVVGVIIVVFISIAGQKKLDQPASTWSDEELARRLPKYQSVLLAQSQAGEWKKAAATNTKIDEIREEIIKRQKAFEAAQSQPLKRESLFSEGPAEEVITEKAIAAADAGDVDVQVLVGSGYLSGANGLPQDTHKAAHYLLKAAESGHGFAAFVVSGLYAEGLGVVQNFDSAKKWALKAKASGIADADQMLAAIDVKRTSY
jgi:TPR repeat protein